MKNLKISLALLFAFALLQLIGPAIHAAEGKYFVYIGTYTSSKSRGIYLFRLDEADGTLTPLGLAGETVNPSFVALHPSGRFLYAVSEIAGFNGQKTGAVNSFSVDPATGKLTLLNKVSSHGGGPCHVVVDKTGKNVLVANYGGGSVAVLPIAEDGRLAEATSSVQHRGSSVNPARQKQPHAHSINLSPDNRFALVADLGLDQILIYHFDPAKGSLTPGDPPFGKVNPGAGPRHFAFHPGGAFAYVINELQSTITAFGYDSSRGTLRELQSVSTLPQGFQGENSTAEIQLHPSGRFLYGSNRGHDSIAVFSVDPAKGTLTPIEQISSGGKTPRSFGIDPTGSFLLAANQDSDSLVVFRINPKNGRLTPAGQKFDVPSPVCVEYLAIR
jgi:6-phosphogluconolactonase